MTKRRDNAGTPELPAFLPGILGAEVAHVSPFPSSLSLAVPGAPPPLPLRRFPFVTRQGSVVRSLLPGIPEAAASPLRYLAASSSPSSFVVVRLSPHCREQQPQSCRSLLTQKPRPCPAAVRS